MPVQAGTDWTSADIWLRREFMVRSSWVQAPTLRIFHDDDAEVYLNGVLAASLSGFDINYEDVPLTVAAAAALKAGKNVIAIHCHQVSGGQYIDAGLVDARR
jgi:hypothetical protein